MADCSAARRAGFDQFRYGSRLEHIYAADNRQLSTKAIYDAWAIPSQIERWFLRSAEYVGVDGASKNRDREVKAGDSYLWRWHGYLDDVSESGMILEANGLDKFAFTFTNGCPVTVSIAEEKVKLSSN
ncbi:MAG: hypothetical protein IPG67_10715 [Acidobacteria bacterium]|nr:hypothetical protein [Acidobacteriota bacterium]